MEKKQHPQHVQATQELENAERLGNEESAIAARKRLAALQESGTARADAGVKRDAAPAGRTTAAAAKTSKTAK